MHTTTQSSTVAGAFPADTAADAAMSDTSGKSFWQRYRLPILLGVIAVGFYVFSIVWIVHTRG